MGDATQEAVDAAAAQLLIELAFLVPRGTDLMATIGPKLIAYRDAVVAATRAERV